MPSPDALDAGYSGSVIRQDYKEVVAKRSDLLKLDGGRLAIQGSSDVTLYAGQVLAQAQTGASAGLWTVVASGATDGSQTASGILKDTVLVLANSSPEIAVIVGGTVYPDLCIGLDSAAITALGGKKAIEHGTNLLTF